MTESEHPEALAQRTENLNSIDQFPPEARTIIERDIQIVDELTTAAEQLRIDLEDRIAQTIQLRNELLRVFDTQHKDGQFRSEFPQKLYALFKRARGLFDSTAGDASGQKISSASTERKRLWCQWQIQLCFENVGKITEEPKDSSFDSDAFARTIQELVASGNEQALTALSSLQKVIASQAKLAVESVVLRFTTEMMKKKTDAYALLSSQKGGEEDQVAHGLSLKKAIWTPEELNKKYSECHAALIRFRQLVMDVGATIDSREGIKVLQDIANGLQPIAESEYTALYEASLKLANRDGYLFHGTTNPEARASILSKGMLFSRKRQEEIYGESHFAMQEAAEAAGLSTALIKQDDAEYEQLCFSLDHPLGTYTSLGRTTQDNPQNVFAVALPAATAFRNYGFFSSDGIHFFSLPDPQQGFELSVNRSNCKLVCDEAAAQQIIPAGNQELLQQYRDVLFNSAEALPKESPAQKIAQARIVPTGILMDKPGSKRSGMVYQLV